MGYSTDFTGAFTLNKPLTAAQVAYLTAFADKRHMMRDAEKTALRDDPLRQAVGLPVGAQGAFFVGETGFCGQNESSDVLEYNNPPDSQPELWCKWAPTPDGLGIQWDGAEKFYCYTEWLNYIIDNFLRPWGIEISGKVEYQGEQSSDFGYVAIKDGRAVQLPGKRQMPE